MSQIAFINEEVLKKIEKINSEGAENSKSEFPEHDFISSCLRIGLTIRDLKELTYIDTMKILLSFIDDKKVEGIATQEDIDRYLG